MQKHSGAPNIKDLRAEADMAAELHFLGHNCPGNSYLVRPIGLNKPKYCGKEFQKVKVV